jgi:putative membrane protein
MKVRAKDFFGKAEKEKIRQAVAEAEKSTTGEIAVMVADASDPYRDAEILGALLMSGLISVVLSLALQHITIWFYIPAVFVLFFPLWYLFKRMPHLKLALVSHHRADGAVRDRAILSFFEKGLHRTRNETGILIFISLLERRVWILGDKGINEKIEPDFWGSLVMGLTNGIRDGRAPTALCTIIAKCGDELARHFPGTADDTNELPDDVIS